MSSQPYRFFSMAWPWERVLDVGSGDNPHPRADVLVDGYLEDVHRFGPLARASEVIIANAQTLPFRDGAFDVVICTHCLEHCDDPIAAARELTRVGRRGIVEVPTPYTDMLFSSPYEQHRWIFARRAGALIFAPRPKPDACLPMTAETLSLVRENALFRAAYMLDEDVFRHRVRWIGGLRIERAGVDEVLASQRQSAPLGLPKALLLGLARAAGCRADRWVARMRRSVSGLAPAGGAGR